MGRRFAAALAVAAFLCAAPAFAAGSQARVLAVKGLAQARTDAAADWKNLSKNDAVADGSEISTGSGSYCEIGFPIAGKASVRFQADSRAMLVSSNPVRVALLSGHVFSLVRELKKNSDFQVSTPTAIASARGTGWDQAPDRIAVFEDTVHLATSAGQEEDVPSGRGFEIGADGTLGRGFAVSDEDMAKWEVYRSQAAKNLDSDFSADTLSLIDQNDPVQDILQNKDAFDDLNDQDALDQNKEKGTDGGTTTGGTGFQTGG